MMARYYRSGKLAHAGMKLRQYSRHTAERRDMATRPYDTLVSVAVMTWQEIARLCFQGRANRTVMRLRRPFINQLISHRLRAHLERPKCKTWLVTALRDASFDVISTADGA